VRPARPASGHAHACLLAMLGPVPRQLRSDEIDDLLATVSPIHLATVDADGFPHITPLWFEWDGRAFWMTSLLHKPHIRRLRADDRASVCLDVELDERRDGERPNRQLRAVGRAELLDDVRGSRTRSITYRYLADPGRDVAADRRASQRRMAIRLEPNRLVAVASV
jgi:nitroimidazol reductase NimA-like FMN-containing flavoprotein (pyridoxamine 5'-phosphate oxidase superfamily)